MKARQNDPQRLAIIGEMLAILERERPWIELFHPEDYVLIHGWMRNVKPPGLSIGIAKYVDIEPVERARMRTAWNRPILWPGFALAVAVVLVVAPGIVTLLRERR